MSKRQKYWLIQICQVAILGFIVWLIPEMPWWKYLILGASVTVYAFLVNMELKL